MSVSKECPPPPLPKSERSSADGGAPNAAVLAVDGVRDQPVGHRSDRHLHPGYTTTAEAAEKMMESAAQILTMVESCGWTVETHCNHPDRDEAEGDLD
jgi:hypothetical protein